MTSATLLRCFACSEIFTSARARDRHKSGRNGEVCLSPAAVGLVVAVPPEVNFLCWALPRPDGQAHD
jgi:hypothetical protein